ncbi:AraC family two component transcriptional regulator [Kineothrix alysoides]|uniref:Stage 0 sporulation protein A homolog n=1 Tax=Kineothrix alysoides TaxID=1469948 RepID=A0A4R1QUW4_9FIRM|nr:response regulator [Kineothrix alysoides]TCL56891.1 AraC family two component transcriptional regulator [Kineothrix alysoides]
MGIKLLVVDDEDNIRNGISNYIRLHSDRIDRIYTACNGQEAIDLILRYRPELMLLDVQMPGKNGLEVMKEASELEILPVTIILSGYDEFRYAQTALKYGVKEYVLKPCRSTEILRLVNEAVDLVLGKEKKESAREDVTDNYLVNRAAEYIKEHYNENLTLVGVANQVDITASYLSALFSGSMDCCFIDYLNGIRVEHACFYLKQNRLKIYEIAFKVGFHDEKYFSKVFKKIKGVSPAQFRKDGAIEEII